MILKTSNLVWGGKVLVALIYGLAMGEVFMRIFAPQPMLPRYVCATEYGVRGNTPNGNYWHKASEYRINIRTNAKGLRADSEIPYEKPPGIKRILLLGDSFGMGYGVSLEDTFLSRCVEALGAAGVKCEPVNLSVSGFGTAEELVALREEGFRYQPDLVIVAWNITDPEDNVRSNLYALQDGQLVRASREYLPAVKTRELFFQLAASRWLAVHSHLYCCLREEAAHLVKLQVLPAMLRLKEVRHEAPPSDGKEAPRDTYPAKLSIALLREIQEQCRQHGAGFLILDIPLRLARTEFCSTFPFDQLREKAEFPIYSPMADFKPYAGQKLFWEKEHGHFTPLGCRIVGEGLARFIWEGRLLEHKEP